MIMQEENLISISEAAKRLGVSLMTLRRWDESGKLVAIRVGERGHRRYRKSDLSALTTDLFFLAQEWASCETGQEPPSEYYCPNAAIFKARFDTFEGQLGRNEATKETFSLIASSAGEIGNNSFDHNLGNWPDIPGIFFAYDLKKSQIVLADRGRGILETLKQVKPELEDHATALQVAFTERISGRREKRGNGLKYVRRIIEMGIIELTFRTGDAKIEFPKGEKELKITKVPNSIHGCLAFIYF